jgi:hypothetical protein
VEYYRRQPPGHAPAKNPADAAAEQAGRLVRRLLPFPSSPDAPALLAPLLPRDLVPHDASTAANPPVGGQQAATIVSEAAAILDEEMARGVLAARGANQPPYARGSDPTNAVLRQVHELVDNVAQIWPGVLGASARRPDASMAASTGGDHEALPHLKPASVLRPGQRGTVSMMLCNKEDRPVRLAPVSTDLIGSSGGRISSGLVEFAPGEIHLAPEQEREVHGRIAVPPEAAPGRYVGLLVVTGVDDLRALITIEVG